MSSHIHVNDATFRQVASILRLTPGEADAVMVRRPFRTLEQLHAALPELAREQCRSLFLRKLDLNLATESELRHLADLRPLQVLRVRAGAPYKSLEGLRRVNGLSEESLQRVLEVFTLHEPGRESLQPGVQRLLTI